MTNTQDPIPTLSYLVPESRRVLDQLAAIDQRVANLKHARAALEQLVERREQELYLEVIDGGLAPAKNAESRKVQLSKALWEDESYRDLQATLTQQQVAVANEEVKLHLLEREWRWVLLMLEIRGVQEGLTALRMAQLSGILSAVNRLPPPPVSGESPQVRRYVPWEDPLPPPRIPQVHTEIPESQKGRPHDAR